MAPKSKVDKFSVFHIAAEVQPFSKVGGLADVSGSLPIYLNKVSNGNIQCIVISPLYKQVKQKCAELKKSNIELQLNVGCFNQKVSLWETSLSNVTYYFIENDKYYNRDAIYSTPTNFYPDEIERFGFLSICAIELIKSLSPKKAIVHNHDWHTSLVALYLKTLYSQFFNLNEIKTLLTIHNFSYQGVFPFSDGKEPLGNVKKLGLEKIFSDIYQKIEFYGKLNFLKAGLYYSDYVSAVSKTYSEEIKTPAFGAGLEGVAQEISYKLTGITNGIDIDYWNPQKDKFLPYKYSVNNLANKKKCKELLQRKMGLDVDTKIPVISFIGRLTEQKGIDILSPALDSLLKLPLQIIILGSGEKIYEEEMQNKAKQYEKNLRVRIEFNEELAHQIYAGSDFLLMPSYFEPCGLNQLYAFRYGTLPIARKTGGLSDTIIDVSTETLAANTATGFLFTEYSSAALVKTVERAIEVFKDGKTLSQLIKNAMRQDFSWRKSAKEYIEIYNKLFSG